MRILNGISKPRRTGILLPALAVISVLHFSLMQAHAESQEEKWPKITVSAGMQMWSPLFADDKAVSKTIPTIGHVIKAHYGINDLVGFSLRATYGGNKITEGPKETRPEAVGLGLGVDFSKNIGKDVVWVNTAGIGYVRTRRLHSQNSAMTGIGAYFVTEFDITIAGRFGFWMDWGCQAVGPSSADTPLGKARRWHFNPLGAGGLRISF